MSYIFVLLVIIHHHEQKIQCLTIKSPGKVDKLFATTTKKAK